VLEDAQDRLKPAKTVGGGNKGREQHGDPEAAFAASVHQIELKVETAAHHHNAMEPGVAVAEWTPEGGVHVRLPTNFSYGDALALAQAFGFGLGERLPRLAAQILGDIRVGGKVRVSATLSGGAFGGKGGNAHLLLVAMAAKANGRAVKLVLTRRQTFSMMPYRGETRQRLRLGADAEGKLTSLIHEATVAKGAVGSFIEPVVEVSAKTYSCPNYLIDTRVAVLDRGAPGWMRAPGASVGQFALEVAMDELAEAAGIDPLDLRLLNYASTEPGSGKEWSSKSLHACYAAGAEQIGWRARNPVVASMKEGGKLIGYGMATAIYPVKQMPAAARITLFPDGTALVEAGTHEIGQGSFTALSQIAAEALGLPLSRVTLLWGDTDLTFGGLTAGSSTTLSLGSAITKAAQVIKDKVIRLAVRDRRSPLAGASPHAVALVEGQLVTPTGQSEAITELLSRHPGIRLSHRVMTGRTFGRSSYARMAFGAQFARVLVDPDTSEVRVDRLVGAFAGGRIVNPMLARSQLVGGMVWGLGQALMEETVLEQRTGSWITADLGEALVPVHADVPAIEAILIDEDDTRGSLLGAKGIGEIGVVGTAAAIANAIHHATGRRLRSLPLRFAQ
jgi:xanthine dehydrogenase YagR molybdenum-binding subunit